MSVESLKNSEIERDALVDKIVNASWDLLITKEPALGDKWPKDHKPFKKNLAELVKADINEVISCLKDKDYVLDTGFYNGHLAALTEETGIQHLNIHELSGILVDDADDILEEVSISIPDEDRTGDEGESRIYGMTYGHMQDEIEGILKETFADDAKEIRYEMEDNSKEM